LHAKDKYVRSHLNLAAWEIAGRPEAIEAWLSQHDKAIAFKPTTPDNPNAVLLAPRNNRSNRQFSTAHIVRTIAEMGYALPLLVPLTWDKRTGILWGVLDDGMEPRAARRIAAGRTDKAARVEAS